MPPSRGRAARPPRGREPGYDAGAAGVMRRLLAHSSVRNGNWTPTGPLRLKSLRFAGLFRPEKPLARHDRRFPRPSPQTLISAWNLLGCHGISSVKKGLGRPQTGSALHHSVTAVSVKKALMIRRGFYALSSHLRASDAAAPAKPVMPPAHTPAKMRSRTWRPRLRGWHGKGIVNDRSF